MKRTIILILTIAFVLCTFSACGANPEKKILGKWYNEKGDCLEILSDNTYSIDKIYTGMKLALIAENGSIWKRRAFSNFTPIIMMKAS